ncbi:hypothetical protein ACQCX5_05195 [Propionibacteriaceae bacterium G57]|uniref:hypothetical protein n=1 Tax=Aestuariimicrobium sp. G57 TaxID=3418485 RepID=UPI003DA7813C
MSAPAPTPRPIRHLWRRALALVAGAALAVTGLTASPLMASAAVPQPGSVPWVNFGDAATKLGVNLTVGYPEASSGHWRTNVKVCNSTGSPLPVGPYTFSYTNYNYGTFFFTTGWTGQMANQLLPHGGCATGYLHSTERPEQMAFHKILQGQTRVDILSATEWEAIFKVREPKSPGTSGTHGDYNNDHRADINGSFGYHYYAFRTVAGPNVGSPNIAHQTISDPVWNWMSKVPDLDVNGSSDLLVRRLDGTMQYQRIMESGKLGFANNVGTNWNGITLLSVVPKSTLSANPWIMARAANGDLIRYQLGATAITGASKIGRNWNSIRHLFSVGDFSGDGVPDLMAIGTNGLLYRYNMTAAGNISSVNVVGHGWGTFKTAFSPGDMNGGGRWDMVGVRNDGKMFFYANIGPGRWSSARQLGGTGWDGLTTTA